MSNKTLLNNRWVLWFHDPLDNNWNLDSYKNIETISTIQEFWLIYSNLDNTLIENSMLFLMKENINPLWEDENNIKGGCWSLKVPKGNIGKLWEKISISLCSEYISNNNDIKINRISISPKKNFCIIKIWINENNNDIKNLNKIDNISFDGIIYKAHNL